jgi:sulfoxide reductase heme-binding subunit YedZ
MTLATATIGPSALWYLTRGTGATTLILMTVSVALGVVNVRRLTTPSVPRFVLDAVHRNASLLALAFLAVHIVTSVLDSFAPINLIDAVIPFTGVYRPLWLGLGALASDLLIAVAVTSVLRRRLGYAAWRATHWLAYASWPVAVLHGLGTGSDAKATWMLALTAGCAAVVLVAVAARVSAGWPDHLGTRLSAAATAALVPVGLLVWLPSGPLAAGWAKRAGTPSSLLVAKVGSAHATSGGGQSSAGGGSPTAFTAQASGTVAQAQVDEGQSEVHISLQIPGRQLTELGVRIFGRPIEGGGISMSSSRVSLGTASDRERYRGEVTGLNGTTIEATVSSGATRLRVLAELQVDPAGGTAGGTVAVSPER